MSSSLRYTYHFPPHLSWKLSLWSTVENVHEAIEFSDKIKCIEAEIFKKSKSIIMNTSYSFSVLPLFSALEKGQGLLKYGNSQSRNYSHALFLPSFH